MKNPIANNRPLALVFALITLALTIVGVTLRIINLYTNFEIDAGYYVASPLVDVMHVFFRALGAGASATFRGYGKEARA